MRGKESSSEALEGVAGRDSDSNVYHMYVNMAQYASVARAGMMVHDGAPRVLWSDPPHYRIYCCLSSLCIPVLTCMHVYHVSLPFSLSVCLFVRCVCLVLPRFALFLLLFFW